MTTSSATAAKLFSNLEELRKDLVAQQTINEDGIVLKKIKLPHLSCFLEAQEEDEIKSMVKIPQEVISRSSINIGSLSIEKVVEVTNKSANSLIAAPLQIFFRGSVLRKLLFRTITRIFLTVTGRDVTFLVKESFDKRSLDTDYLLFTNHCYAANRWLQIIDHGLVSHLTDELKKKTLKPAVMCMRKQKKSSYPLKELPKRMI
jgi:hypothetical protein